MSNPFREVYLQEKNKGEPTRPTATANAPDNAKKKPAWLLAAELKAEKKEGKLKEDTIQEATVDTKKYSWGTMKTVHHGSSFSIPLHPEHHQAIAKLKDEQEHKFKDETGRHWTARRKGEDVHFQGANDGNKTKVKHSTMHEEVELEEARANHRDFASQGKMHPDMAKHMDVGSHMDYYEPKTGDKVHGKVMHKSDAEVHMKQTHDSYDPKKTGTVHKFKISSKLDEEIIAEEEGYTLHSKHTNPDGTVTIVLKTPSGKLVKHKGKTANKTVMARYGIQSGVQEGKSPVMCANCKQDLHTGACKDKQTWKKDMKEEKTLWQRVAEQRTSKKVEMQSAQSEPAAIEAENATHRSEQQRATLKQIQDMQKKQMELTGNHTTAAGTSRAVNFEGFEELQELIEKIGDTTKVMTQKGNHIGSVSHIKFADGRESYSAIHHPRGLEGGIEGFDNHNSTQEEAVHRVHRMHSSYLESAKWEAKHAEDNHKAAQSRLKAIKEETEELQNIEEIAKVRSWRYDKNNPSIHSRTDHADTPETRNQLAKDIKANRKHNAGKIGVSSGMVRSNAKGATDSQKTVKLGPDNVQLRTYRGIAKSKMHKEEVEKIDEISAKLAGNYYGAATKKHLDKVGMKPNMYGRIEKDMGKNRKAGVDRALDRVMGARKTNEEVSEHLNMKKASMGDVIKDFKGSSAPQFAGKSPEKRRKMAIAAKMNSESVFSFKNYVELEDLDEAAWPGTDEYKKKYPDSGLKKGESKKGASGTITGTGSGVKHERDYDKAEKQSNAPAPASGEKRGRGRPAGSASGARVKGSAPKSDDKYDSTGFKLHLPGSNKY